MPRFFFDIDEGGKLSTDRDGLEMEGPEAAREAALKTLAEIARDLAPIADMRQLIATIRDETSTSFRVLLCFRCERP